MKAIEGKLKGINIDIWQGKDKDGNLKNYYKIVNKVIDAHNNLNTIINKNGKITQKVSANIQNVSTETHKYTKKNGELVTRIKEVNSAGQTFYTQINQTENELGEITRITQKYDAQNHKLGEAIKEVYQDETKLTQAQKARAEALTQEVNTTKEFNTLEKGIIVAVKEEAQVVTDADGKITSLTKTTKSWKDTNGYLHESIVTVDQDGKQVGRTIENIKKAEQNTAKQTQEFGQQAQTLGERFANMVKNFATFYVATLPTQLFRQAISESVQLVKDFDKALIEFQKVSSYSGETLDAYTDKLARMGEVTGSTMTAMVEASTEFKKSGYTEEDSAKLASIAEINTICLVIG
jgi:DNA-binding ferritin-like protein (Dps family)